MSWQSVPICDEHWNEEEPERVPYRIVGIVEPCYRCGTPSDIYVRRDVPKEGS